MAATTCYATSDGNDMSSFYSDTCPVCSKTHHLYSFAQANGAYRCYGAGGNGTPVDTTFAGSGVPPTATVRALIAAGSVVES